MKNILKLIAAGALLVFSTVHGQEPTLANSDDIAGLQSQIDGKQATLVSGTNIKRVNGSSILGSGDLTVGGGTWGGITGTLSSQTDLQTALDGKAPVIDATKSPYNAVGDGKRIDDGAISSGAAILTSATASFVAGDVGKYIRVTGAGTAGAELITTIASRQSATQVTLTASAATTVSGASFVYGTDNTTAINAALAAALASSSTGTVFIPPGVYIGNFIVPNKVNVRGAGVPSTTGFDAITPASINAIGSTGTALLQATTETPVISASTDGCFHSVWQDFAVIAGQAAQLGVGLEVGAGPSGYEGGSSRFANILVTGFNTGISFNRTASMQFDVVESVDSVYCIRLGERGPADTSVFNACITGGSRSSYCFYIEDSKAITIAGGDHNLADGFIYADTSSVAITSANCEQIQGSAITLLSSKLSINYIKSLNAGGPLVSALDGGSAVSILEANHDQSSGTIHSRAVIYRTATAEYPEFLPAGFLIARYTATDWLTLSRIEHPTYIYHLARNGGVQRKITDEFMSRYATPFSTLGWEITNIGGTNAARAFSGPHTGAIEFYGTTASATNQGRFGLPATIYGPLNFRLSMTLSDITTANAILRAGLYSLDGTVDMTPTHGVGILLDRSVPHANIQFEVVSSGVSTLVDSGIPYTRLTSNTEFIIERNTVGLFLFCRAEFGQSQLPLYPQVKHTADVPAQLLAPSFFHAVTNADYHTLRIERFDLECYPTSP